MDNLFNNHFITFSIAIMFYAIDFTYETNSHAIKSV